MANPTMTKADVARLLGRVAFGATAADFDEWTGKKYADLVEKLLDVPPLIEGRYADEPARLMAGGPLGYSPFQPGAPDMQLRLWWLERMGTTPWPLLERMTLFWHGHFATALRFERGPYPNMMALQNQTLRRNALGNFRTLVEELTVDPAMLVWLNGDLNRMPDPNENYAREFFELFTLGKRPQVYTERDVREAARAFTGWSYDYTTLLVYFDPGAHDQRDKVILGQRIGNLGDQEYKKVVEIALKEPVAPRFVAWKLVAEFAYVPGTRNLLASRDGLVNAVASTLRSGNWDVKAAMRKLLLSDDFRAAPPSKRRQVVRQPVEIAVAACKALGTTPKDIGIDEVLGRMGQDLFSPPNVGGWPKGEAWLSPISSLARYDLGIAIGRAHREAADTGGTGLPAPDDLDAWARRLGVAGWSRNTAATVRRYLGRQSDASDADKRAGVLALLVASPDFGVM